MDTAESRNDPELEPDSEPGDGLHGERSAASELNPSAPENQPIPGENPEDDVLPISPGRRRLGMYIGMLFILIILTFLVWFVATHTEQAEPGAVFGQLSPVSASVPVA